MRRPMGGNPRRPLLSLLATVALIRLAAGLRLAADVTDANLGDVGQWVDAGDRIRAGLLPGRDWMGPYGPLVYAWGAGWSIVLGSDWRAALLMLEVVSPLACLGLAALAAARLPGWIAPLLFLGAAAAASLDACYWSPGLRIWAPVAVLAWAESVLGRAEPAPWWAAAAGAACGACVLISPDTGVAAAAAAALLAMLSRGPGRPRAALAAGLPAVPALALAAAPAVVLGWIRDTADLGTAYGWLWGVPLPSAAHPGRRAILLAPLAAAAAFMVQAAVRPRDRAADLAWLAFALGSFRSALGRADVPHLLFALPPALYLACRLAGRSARPRLAAAVVAAAWLPYTAWSFREGQSGRTLRAFRPPAVALAPLAGERVRVPAWLAERLQAGAAAARPLARPGGRVLSLPVPVYARLLGGVQALPAAAPELLAARPGGAEAAAAVLASDPPPVAIWDPALALPGEPAFQSPPEPGPIAWASPADEAATRPLRALLRDGWRVVRKVAAPPTGSPPIRILAPHNAPAPAPRAAVVARLEVPPGAAAALVRGDLAVLPAGSAAGDEIRFRVRCGYAPGLAWLAKTYVRALAVHADGTRSGGALPVPPASLDLELRVAVRRAPVEQVTFEVGGAGSLNPAPRSVELLNPVLIRYDAW